MLNTSSYSDVEHHCSSEEEAKAFYSCEEEAIYALYEQLFESLNNICADTVLKAMRYLILKKEMINQIDEITRMTPDDVCVVHHREIEKYEENTIQEIKNKLYGFLENEIK